MNDPPTETATCLGCGCLCDDVGVETADGRITRLVNVCRLGERWFGDGVLPAETRIDGRPASIAAAVAAAADLLFAEPGRLLIYVAGDLACETHREAAALADRLGATIDGPASDTVADGLLAAQRRGRAGATLGELRHRADLVLFWGVDPDVRYPRFMERFVDPPPTRISSRQRIAVDIGADRGPAACSERLVLDPAEEVDALLVMRAAVQGRRLGEVSPPLTASAALACRLATAARYVGIVFDAEPTDLPRDPALAEGLIALAQTLNGPTRAALWGLRGGGNRNGLESLLTWQTGYSFAIDFGNGFPSYGADECVAERLDRGRFTAALVLGAPTTIPPAVSEKLSAIATVAVGPRASEAAFRPAVAIDTGAASLHEGGLVLRMDDVPIQVHPILVHPVAASEIVRKLATVANLPMRGVA